MIPDSTLVPLAGFVAWLVGAVLSAGAMLWIWRHGERARPDRIGLMVAAGASDSADGGVESNLESAWCSFGGKLVKVNQGKIVHSTSNL